MRRTNRRQATEDTLNAEMSPDHVIYSFGDGTIADCPGQFAPDFLSYQQDDETWQDERLPEPWEALTGWTGQHGYNGPHMYGSEYIGGGLARHILETEGVFVAVDFYGIPLDEREYSVNSWAILHIPAEEGNMA